MTKTRDLQKMQIKDSGYGNMMRWGRNSHWRWLWQRRAAASA